MLRPILLSVLLIILIAGECLVVILAGIAASTALIALPSVANPLWDIWHHLMLPTVSIDLTVFFVSGVGVIVGLVLIGVVIDHLLPHVPTSFKEEK